MAFKMKQSPVKGKLEDFFGGLASQLKRGTARRKDKKYEAAGPNVRKQMEKEGYAKPIARTPGSFSTKRKLEGELVVNQELMDKKIGKSKPKTKGPDWKKAPKVGTKARTDWYKKHNLKLDDTTPSYKSKINAGGPGAFQGDPEKENWGATSRVPLTKKSPYKKGISKNYTKKPKGSRGFKMNR